jgi:tripartite-type tricarboxylate transporter receptor subunit TctC
VPTLEESGIAGLDVSQWRGILVPKGTPDIVIDKLHADFAEVLMIPDIKARMTEIGEEPMGGSPEQLGRFVQAEIAKFRGLVRETKLVVD